MNVLERFPFEFIFDIPAQSVLSVLSVVIYSRVAQADSIEAADEFVDLFAQSVSGQFYSTDVTSRLEITKSYFDQHKSAHCYEMVAEAVDPMAYTVLTSLLYQATLLEEPICKVVIRSDSSVPGTENFTSLAERFYALELPQKNLPFNVEWNDPEPENTGFDVLIEFDGPLSDSAFEAFDNSMMLLDNLMFMYGFRFDLDDQSVFFPRPGLVNRLSPSTVTYTSDFKEGSQFYFCLFNVLKTLHLSGLTINVVEIE